MKRVRHPARGLSRATGATGLLAPSSIERYELKFTIPPTWVERISSFIAPYCSLDPHSRRSADGYYQVNTLYLDSPRYRLLRNRLATAPDRFNVRVRAYGEDSCLPHFLEIKQRSVNAIRKFRCRTNEPAWATALTGSCAPRDLCRDPQQQRNFELFDRLVCSYRLEPKMLTQYRRLAWVSDVDDYGRVTFDIDLRYAPRDRFDLTPRPTETRSYDTSRVFDPGCSVVLELKSVAGRVPLWMLELIKRFSLRRRSFSKYASAALEMFRLHDWCDAAAVSARLSA